VKFAVCHGYVLPADGAIVFDFGPVFEALAVEDVLVGAEQHVDSLFFVDGLVADGAVAARVDDVPQSCLLRRNVDECPRLMRLAATATAENAEGQADEGRKRDEEATEQEGKFGETDDDDVYDEIGLCDCVHVGGGEGDDGVDH